MNLFCFHKYHIMYGMLKTIALSFAVVSTAMAFPAEAGKKKPVLTAEQKAERKAAARIRAEAAERERQLKCLSLNIYHEARGEGTVGMEAVAHVTLNRVDSGKYPKTICAVVYQAAQFSWTIDGTDPVPHNKKAYERCKEIAKNVLFKRALPNFKDPTHGSLFYHTHAVKPKWSKNMQLAVVIGEHRFYNK